MCYAFSCLVDKDKKVTWKFNIDSHDELMELAGYKNEHDTIKFVRVEIKPKNGDYINPDEWVFVLDEKERPDWFSPAHEQACWDAFKEFEKELYKILQKNKKIVNPFKDIKKVRKVSKTQILLLKRWMSVRDSVDDSISDSVWCSVWDSVDDSISDSVRDSVDDSIRNSVWCSVWHSVKDSVWCSVWDSVCDSIRAYIGSFFILPRNTDEYPFQSAVDLWEQGLVPSFDCTTWRLHSGKKAKVVFEISNEDLKNYQGE